jgi:hypothetical protein
MAQVIFDLAFLNAYNSKIAKQKYSEKTHIPGEVYSLYFLLQDFPPTVQ